MLSTIEQTSNLQHTPQTSSTTMPSPKVLSFFSGNPEATEPNSSSPRDLSRELPSIRNYLGAGSV